jgi:hypothetical protein
MMEKLKKSNRKSRSVWGAVAILGALVLFILPTSLPVLALEEGGSGGSHLPDLEVINITVGPPFPNVESRVFVHSFVWNCSDVVIPGPIKVHIGIDGIEVKRRFIPELRPWEAVPVEAAFESIEIGDYGAFVTIDPDNEINEEHEWNNMAFTPFHVGLPLRLPDLAVIELRVRPDEATPGDEILIEGTVWNGSEVMVEGPVSIVFGVDNRPVGEPIIIGDLFPREAIRVAALTEPVEPGDHVAFMHIDPENEVREIFEFNNIEVVPFEVHLPPPASVDLIRLSERVLPPDGLLEFETILRNHTDGYLTFPLRLIITRPGDGEHIFWEKEIRIDLEAGQEAAEIMEVPLPDDPFLEPGRYLLVGEAGDFDRDVFEFHIALGQQVD